MYHLFFQKFNEKVSLTLEEQEKIKTYLTPKKLRKKQYLLQEGDVCKAIAFVEKGALREYSIDESGTEHIVQFAVEDWWIGDMYSFLTQTPAMYTIEALEDCELLQIDKNGLEELYLKLPKMERFFRIIIQNAFVASQKRIISSMSQSADERYLAFIEKYPAIEQRIPQYQVAAYLGITPEFLSRIRKKFASK